MATGPIDYSSQNYYGVFNRRGEAHIEGISDAEKLALSEQIPRSFGDLHAHLPVYRLLDSTTSLADRVFLLRLNDSHLSGAPLPKEVTEDTVTQVRNTFAHMNLFFSRAAEDYKQAILTNSPDLEALQIKYSKAQSTLNALVNLYKPTKEEPGKNSLVLELSEFHIACVNLQKEYAETTFYDLPLAYNLSGATGQRRAQGALENFRAVVRYFDTGPGRFASADAQKELLKGVVFDLHQSLNELDITERTTFQNAFMTNANELDHFSALKVRLFQRLSQEEFNRQVMRYLFSDQQEPSESLKRSAYMDPRQKGKLLEWTQLKKQALEQGHATSYHKLPTQLLTRAFYAMSDAFTDLRYGSSKTAQEIIMEVFYEDRSYWFPDRRYGEAFGDDSNEDLRVLAETEETDFRAQRARCEALQSLARRTQEAMQAAMLQPRKREEDKHALKMAIVTRIEHACKAETRAESLLQLKHVLDGLGDSEDKVFLRLELLAQWNHQYGEAFFKGADKGGAYRGFTLNYEEAQSHLLGNRLGPNLPEALLKAIELSQRDIAAMPGLSEEQRNALVVDDLEFFLKFIPTYTITDGYGDTAIATPHPYPNLRRFFGKDLEEIKKQYQPILSTKTLELVRANQTLQVAAAALQATLTAAATPAAPAAPGAFGAIGTATNNAITAGGATAATVKEAAKQAILAQAGAAPGAPIHSATQAAIDAAFAAIDLYFSDPSADIADKVEAAIRNAMTLEAKVTITAADPNPLQLTSAYLLDRFDQLIRKADDLSESPALQREPLFDKKQFAKNKKLLVNYLRRNKAAAQQKFMNGYQPDMKQKMQDHKRIYEDLRQIERYISQLQLVNDNARELIANVKTAETALGTAQIPTGGWLGTSYGASVNQRALNLAEADYNAANEALNIPTPLAPNYPASQQFQLPRTIENYGRPPAPSATTA